jgi:hypothetical protein
MTVHGLGLLARYDATRDCARRPPMDEAISKLWSQLL